MPANSATTVVLASSGEVRLGTAWNVARIVPKRYSVVIASAAITMTTIRPKFVPNCVEAMVGMFSVSTPASSAAKPTTTASGGQHAPQRRAGGEELDSFDGEQSHRFTSPAGMRSAGGGVGGQRGVVFDGVTRSAG